MFPGHHAAVLTAQLVFNQWTYERTDERNDGRAMNTDTLLKRYDADQPITCEWCDARFRNSPVWDFKINAEGLMSCRDCRKTPGMAWGHGPWLFIGDLLRAKGITAAGTLLASRSRRFSALPPEETIQPS